MTYYYPPGTVLPPQTLNDKPGIYGAYNGAIPVSMAGRPGIQLMQPGMAAGVQPGMAPGMPSGMGPAVQPGMNPSIQTGMNPSIQTGINPGLPPGLSPARPPSSPGMPQPPQATHGGPQPPPIGIAGAAQLPVASSAGFGSVIQPSHYVGSAAAAGLYQGANLAYPQHSVSPAAAGPPLAGTTFMGGRSVSLYGAGTRMPAPMPASTYPGTAYSMVYPAAPAFSAPAPTYTVGSAQTFPEAYPVIPTHIQQQPMGSTAIPAYAAPASYPAGVQPGQAVPGMPLMASPPYPAGASPYQRSMP